MKQCNMCKSTEISDHVDNEAFIYKGNTINVPVHYSVCEKCGREFISKDQIILNDQRLRDEKRIFDGLLTSSQIVKAREYLNLTQELASLLFGGGRNAFSKYERGEVSQSKSMDNLIRLCLYDKSAYISLLRITGLEKAVEYKHSDPRDLADFFATSTRVPGSFYSIRSRVSVQSETDNTVQFSDYCSKRGINKEIRTKSSRHIQSYEQQNYG